MIQYIKKLVFAGFSLIMVSCRSNDIDPSSDFTGRYNVSRSGLEAVFGYGSSLTDELEVRKAGSDTVLLLSYGTTELHVSMTGNTFRIPVQGMWITERDGQSYLASITGEGLFSAGKISYSYVTTYNNMAYGANGIGIVRGKKQ